MFQKQREHVWAKGMTRDPVEAYGKTLRIIGAGSIGYEVAVRAKAFGMYTLAFMRIQNLRNVMMKYLTAVGYMKFYPVQIM